MKFRYGNDHALLVNGKNFMQEWISIVLITDPLIPLHGNLKLISNTSVDAQVIPTYIYSKVMGEYHAL